MPQEQGFSRGRRGLGSSRGGGRGDRRGDRRGRGRGRGRGFGGRPDEQEWVPFTKLGRLVKSGKITSINEIFFYSMPIKEYQIVDHLLGPDVLQEELIKVYPVQKQTNAGQRTRFKAVCIVGDKSSVVGLGIKCSKEASTSIRGAIIAAKMALIPVRKGFWGSRYGQPHTVPGKITGKCGSVRVRLIPAPRGTGLVAAKTPRTVLHLAGFEDMYTSSSGKTRTRANFAKATFSACAKTYGYLTPDLWPDTTENLGELPFSRFAEELSSDQTPANASAKK